MSLENGHTEPVESGPVPMNVRVGRVTLPLPFVVLTIKTAQGEQSFWFPPDAAEGLAAQMVNTAKLARSGLHIPGETQL